MFVDLVVATVVVGAVGAGLAAGRYRLAVEFVPALVILAGFAAFAPAWVAGMINRTWPVALSEAAAAAMAMAAAFCLRTRAAQLLPGWFRTLQGQLDVDVGDSLGETGD